MAFWYHFAIMFEALFILTAVDAGTRVSRFQLQDTIGNIVPAFKNTSWRPGVFISTAIMVAGWGAILLMGVTDPLGGINTLFPLFGIANQLLAAIALAVCLAIIAKNNNFRWLWVVAVPLAFVAVVTISASFLKIFSPVTAVGYWANHIAFRNALEAGETSHGTAQTVEAMEAVVRNTFIQGTLSIIFVTLAIIVIATAVRAAVSSYRSGGGDSSEDPRVESRVFAPSGLAATAEEREIQKQWDALPASQRSTARTGH
jgi:carbon starvation protein